MSADEQNTPHVIAEMRKLKGIDRIKDWPETAGNRTGTTVKSPDSYLSLDQLKFETRNFNRAKGIKVEAIWL